MALSTLAIPIRIPRERDGVGYLPTYAEAYYSVIPAAPSSPTSTRPTIHERTQGFVTTDFTLVQGDTSPPLRDLLLSADRSRRDLTHAETVELRIYRGSGAIILEGEAVVEDVDGAVSYQWVDGDTDLAGEFFYRWRVTDEDGTVAHFPDGGPGNRITIEANPPSSPAGS